ncbi:hypothetical protein Poli38472_013189 [Pythium oligandrum]|uniref:Uncharacterized protein n=1 Tax=Pythium oligandrum TaxID=41045 RepID=A0A8K1C2R2_PYTOL|nr:hypothetical protein Poli38472_013189 [Pythium oligandrum]|eukprot:TMW55298.1 hypothetical protein Poli38472_013189 [Pythium oligandrum]
MHELVLVKMMVTMLCIAILVTIIIWTYRYIQYRRAVRLSQMRWLHFEADKIFDDTERSLNWPTAKPIMLSPIPEEHGRESMDSLASAQRDRRVHTASFLSYGSFEHAGP